MFRKLILLALVCTKYIYGGQAPNEDQINRDIKEIVRPIISDTKFLDKEIPANAELSRPPRLAWQSGPTLPEKQRATQLAGLIALKAQAWEFKNRNEERQKYQIKTNGYFACSGIMLAASALTVCITLSVKC